MHGGNGDGAMNPFLRTPYWFEHIRDDGGSRRAALLA